MFPGRLSNIVESRRQERAAARIFGQVKLSCWAVETLSALVELTLLALAPAIMGIVYLDLSPGSALSVRSCSIAGIGSGLIHVYSARLRGLYRLPVLSSPGPNLGRTLTIWFFTIFIVTIFITYLDVLGALAALPLLLTLAPQLPLLAGARMASGKAVRSLLESGSLRGRRTVVIGEACELLGLSPGFLLQSLGLSEVARVQISSAQRRRPDEIAADIDRAFAAAGDHEAEEFLLALRWDSKALLESILARLRPSSLPVRLLPDRNVRVMLLQHGFSPERGLFPLPLQKAGLTALERAAKRGLDILGAAAAIAFLAPVFVFAAIAIKLDSKGPVIFRQKRTGLNAKEFMILKFRTMTVLEDGPAVRQASRGDHRVTRVGKVLRRSSIDELPQLFNVLKGDMSLVGPRPHAVAHDKYYKALISDYGFRHYVKPGITGWAQVNGLRGETPSLQQMAERVELDRWYINNWSTGLDLSILLRTCFEVLRDHAY